MRYSIVLILASLLVGAGEATAQSKQLSTKWEELTAGDFREAIAKSQGTCVLPFGILEKHGPHLPLGTDLLKRAVCCGARRAAGICGLLSPVLRRTDF